MSQGLNKLVTYNTLNEDDVEFGVQLGCNGIVHILFEPIDPGQTNNPIVLLEKCVQERKNAVLVTLFSLKNYHGHQPGTCFFFDAINTHDKLEDKNLAAKIQTDAEAVLEDKSSVLKEYNDNDLTAFVELIQPPVSLIVIGAGNDALPLVNMATLLGWQVTVIDGRPNHSNRQRFPMVHDIIVGKPVEVIKQIVADERTVFVLMTHNYNYDLAMMEFLLQKKCSYIGTLGPKKRLHRMLNELEEKGVPVSDEERSIIYGPTGLDIGAEGAEEIALSILAEIKAVIAQRPGTFLRDRQNDIHSRSASGIDVLKAEAWQ